MSEEYEQRLEAEIHRELRGLPDMPAPGTLVPRVMAAIAARTQVAWYRQSWQMWPAPVRVASLLVGLALLGAFCFCLWKLPQVPVITAMLHNAAGWFSGVSAIWNTVNALLGTVVLLVKQLSLGFIIGCIAAFGLAWTMCFGLGTMWVRLALVRR